MLVFSLVFASCGTATTWAQEKVAEGVYRSLSASRSGGPAAVADSRWVLYSTRSGGYRLESEIQGMPEGRRLVQLEELDKRFIPQTVGYRTFIDNQKEAAGRIDCKIDGAITCSVRAGEEWAANSQPYRYKGPFWIWVENLVDVDLAWLLDGAVNMARAGGDAKSIATIRVFDSDKPHQVDFSIDEEQPLDFIGAEQLEFNGKKIFVKHYRYGTQSDLWITDSGVLIKESVQQKVQYLLTDYRQYKKLIPELDVETGIVPANR